MHKTQLIIRKPKSLLGLVTEIKLPITLGRSATPLGKDQEIDRYVTEETTKAIPVIKDQELIRFRLKTEPSEARTIVPYFRASGTTQLNTYQAAGFTTTQTRTLTQGLARSMYIFELYDEQDSDTQVLLSRAFCKGDDANTYAPVYAASGVLIGNSPLLQMASTTGVATTVSPLALPLYFLRRKPSGTIYLRISFFNSTTGKRVRMRRRLTGLSIADSNYVPLVYDATTRLYHMPAGDSIEIEEIPASAASIEAEKERKNRVANMTTTPRLGDFQPLGPPKAINYFATTGATSGNGTIPVSGTTTTNGTISTLLDVPGTLVPTKKYVNLSSAHLATSTEPTTGVRTTTGILTVGLPVYRPDTPATVFPDGWWAYFVSGSYPPPRVMRVLGGIITQINVSNPDIVNVLQIQNAAIDPTRHPISQEACLSEFDGTIALPIYTSNGVLAMGGAIFTQPNFGGRLGNGFYVYSTNLSSTSQTIVRISFDVISYLNVSCPTKPPKVV